MSERAAKFSTVSGARLKRARATVSLRGALSQFEEEKTWVCESCGAPLHDTEKTWCVTCGQYWEDAGSWAYGWENDGPFYGMDDTDPLGDEDGAYEEYLAELRAERRDAELENFPWTVGAHEYDFIQD